MSQELKFKHKKTLRHLLILLLGIVLIVVGLIGYFWTRNFIYFYVTIGANVFIVYGFIASQVQKNQVVYDLIFIKYKLLDKKVQRFKIEEINTVERQGASLHINLINDSRQNIDLSAYSKASVDEFENLIERLRKKDRISS